MAEGVIALDPGYASAYSYAAMSLSHEVLLGSYTNPREALERGMKLVQRAVALDESLAHPHEILSKYYIYLNKDYEKGVAEAERAVALEPNSVDAYTQLVQILGGQGDARKPFPSFRRPCVSVLFLQLSVWELWLGAIALQDSMRRRLHLIGKSSKKSPISCLPKSH